MSIDEELELSDKVDALLKRHAPAALSVDDRNIPLLSEIVHAPEWKPEPGNPTLPATLSDDEQRKLANDVFERVFRKVEGELALRVETRLVESLAAQVGPVLQHVIADMRQDIANVIGDAINAALNEALSRRISNK